MQFTKHGIFLGLFRVKGNLKAVLCPEFYMFSKGILMSLFHFYFT